MTNQNDPAPTPSEQEDRPKQNGNGQSPEELAFPKVGTRIGLVFAVMGYFFFLLGARPSLFGLDRSRVIGFVQISVFLVGLGLITFGSYLTLNAMWSGIKKTIAAEIGSRLISTGYVISVFTAMADIFGLGSHRLPDVFFGPLQARGVGIGMATIAIGFLLLIRYRHPEDRPMGSGDSRTHLQDDEEEDASDPKNYPDLHTFRIFDHV